MVLERDRYLQWDYGLSMDLELLCHHRKGRVPFEFLPHLWTILSRRRDQAQDRRGEERLRDYDDLLAS